MTVLNRNPQNTNPLQPTKFLLTFPDISDTMFFCQKVNIPGVSVPENPRQIPNVDLYTPVPLSWYQIPVVGLQLS